MFQKIILYILMVTAYAGQSQILDLGSVVVLRCPNGQVFISGNNEFGSLGQGFRGGDTAHFIPVPHLDSITAVSAGAGHVLTLQKSGKMNAWGRNDVGQLGIGSLRHKATPRLVDTLENITAISAGFTHSLALASDSTVWGFGENFFGECGLAPPPYGLLKPQKADTLQDIVKISAGDNHSLALQADGTVWSMGDNRWGQRGIGNTENNIKPTKITNLDSIVDVFASMMFTSYAINQNGYVYAWGRNENGQLGVPNDLGKRYSSVPRKVSGIRNAIKISAGSTYALALLRNGKVMAWGFNNYYQLGDSTKVSRNTPKIVRGLNSIMHIQAAGSVGMAIDSTGQIYSWGASFFGTLASGQDTIKPIPTVIPNAPCNPVLSTKTVENVLQNEVRVFPNPTSARFTLQTGSPVQQVKLLHVNGQVLRSWPAQSSYNIAHLPSGLYLLQVITEEGSRLSKIWKR